VHQACCRPARGSLGDRLPARAERPVAGARGESNGAKERLLAVSRMLDSLLNPGRLIAAVLFVFIGVTLLNFVLYQERRSALQTASSTCLPWETVCASPTPDPFAKYRAREPDPRVRSARNAFVNHEIVIVIVAGAVLILLWRLPRA